MHLVVFQVNTTTERGIPTFSERRKGSERSYDATRECSEAAQCARGGGWGG